MKGLLAGLRAGGLLLLAVAAVWALSRLQFSPPTEVVVFEDPFAPRYQMRRVQLTRLDQDGKPQLRVEAEGIDYFDNDFALLDTVSAMAPGTDSPVWRLTSPTGHIPAGETRLVLDGPVEGSGQWPDGEPLRFSTPNLSLDWALQELSTDAGVRVDSRGRTARADRLKGTWNPPSLQLSGNVRIDYASR